MTDPHATKKAASMTSVDECDGWIAEARAKGDEDKARLGVARRAELMRRAR